MPEDKEPPKEQKVLTAEEVESYAWAVSKLTLCNK